MQIDLHALNAELLTYLKESVNSMPDSELIARARPMKELLKGLKQDKPNVDSIKERVLGKMLLKNLPPPILELLRSATLADSLIKVLSEKALTEGIVALYERFDHNPVLASMLLDERENIRKFANAELAKPRKPLGKIKAEDTFKIRFGPLIGVLKPVLDDQPYQPPVPNVNPGHQIEPIDPTEKQIRASTLFKQTLRERNAFEASNITLTDELKKNKENLSAGSQRVLELNTQILTYEKNLKNQIAEGIADGLNHRIAPWLEATNPLAQANQDRLNPIEAAANLVVQQEISDKRFGTRSRIKEEINESKILQAKLKSAQVESLRPLKGLSEAVRSLESHIEYLEKLLSGTTLEPANPKLKILSNELQPLNTLDELKTKKQDIEKIMAVEAWGMELCKNTYALIERAAMRIYLSHEHPNASDKADLPLETPQQQIEYCLRMAKPLRLMIDGHNMLPKLKPFIGGQYFSERQGPNSEGRKLLIDRVKLLTDRHPLIQGDIWFDSPIEQDWTETENLRIWFSGGKGADRADTKILDSLQSMKFQNSTEFRFLVTEDRDLLQKGQALKAIGVSPIEMWIMLN